jgi:PAS domain S-box-containing protein
LSKQNKLDEIKTTRTRLLLAALIVLAAGLFLVDFLDLIAALRHERSWLETRGIPVLVVSFVFLLTIVVASWLAWFQVRQRERARDRVLRSEQKYRTIINHAGEAIFLLDRGGVVLEWNKTAEQLFGVPRRAVLGKYFKDIHLCYGLEIEKAMADTQNMGQSLVFDFPFPRSGKPGALLNLSISPINTGGESGQGDQAFVVIARDVTSERQLESRMSEAEKLAGIGQLAAGIAHQLNTPLGSILLSAQMLSEASLPEDEQEDVQRIIRQTEQCRTIIKGLLNFARPQHADRGVLALGDAVRETTYLMEKSFKIAGVEVVIEETDQPVVYGNRNELDQVFFNLLANALDAMPGGGRITMRVGPAGPGEVQVEVIDTGEGIPVENRERIFLPFFTTKEYGRGTGLGLSIVARIVHEHGGRIEMDSDVGRGTRFLLTFPEPAYGLGRTTAASAVAMPEG